MKKFRTLSLCTFSVLAFCQANLNTLTSSVYAQDNSAAAPVSKETSQTQGVFDFLYNMLDGLEFSGWQPVRAGLYVDENGKFKQILPAAYLKKLGLDSGGIADQSQYNALRSTSFRPSEEGILRECGCHVVAQKLFRRGNRLVTFEGFQFNNEIGAQAGYNFLRSGSTTVLKRGDGSSEDAQSISFWQGNYFFRIFTSEEDDDEAKGVVSQFANVVNSKLKVHAGSASIIGSLPVMDRVKGSEKIVLGPLAAKHYVAIPYINTLAIESSRGAAVVDYQVFHPHRERLKVLYIDYGDPIKAQKAYYNFATNIGQLKAPLSGGPQSSPRSLFKINKRFLLCELKPRGRVIVISGARKKKSAGVLAAQI